jgi:NAD(P)-dependent dehydrogenase (short-subunit alcohol dehydrogenase family)
LNIDGLRAAVVGGASGMARATAVRLSAGGGHVAIMDLPDSEGAAVAGEIGNGAVFHSCDVTDFEGMETVLGNVVSELGGLDAVVNTAGGGAARRTLSKDGPHPLDSFQWVLNLNLVGSFNVNRLAAAHMAENDPNEDGERGVMINTASIAAFEGQIGQVAYSAAKAGIAGMCLTMARDLGSLGIRVNAIAPSLFATGITEGIPDEFADKLTKDAAFPRRLGRPDEYARLAVAIIENPMLNGGCIRLDAGQRFAPR